MLQTNGLHLKFGTVERVTFMGLIFLSFSISRVTGQKFSLSRDISGFNYLKKKGKLMRKKTRMHFNFIINSYFSGTNSYFCVKISLKLYKISSFFFHEIQKLHLFI